METIRISDIGTVITGKTPSSKNPEHFGYDYPFITPTDIVNGRIVHTERRISKEGQIKFRRQMLPPRSVCFTCIGTIGKICMTTEESLTNQQINSVVVNSKRYDPFFIYYLLSTYANKIKNIAGGAAVPIVNKMSFESIELPVPPLPTQRKIAAVLSAYDDLIENNLRRIKILEQMAQNFYREWFVKFRFPGYEKVRFVDSSLGRVPEGWAVKALSEVCNLTMGQSPKSEFYNESGDGLPFHQGVTDFGSRFPTTRLYCTVKSRIAEVGDILFSVRAPVGRINIAPTQMAIGRGLSAIRHSNGYQHFAFYMLKNRFKEEDSMGGGTIFKSVTKADMQSIEFLSADDDLHVEFEKIVSPFENQIENLTKKNTLLRQTRDLLLPKLISGEIDVSELAIQTNGSPKDRNDIRRYDFFQHICCLPFVDKIVLFGSRARGDHHDRSDIDLAVFCDRASDAEWQQVLDCLREDRIDTLLKVDCVHFERSNAALKEHITIEGKVLYEKDGQQIIECPKKTKEPTIMSETKLANHLSNSQRCLKRLDDAIRQPLDEDMFMLDAVVHRFNIAFELLMDTLLEYCVESDLLPKERVKEYELNARKLIELAFDCKLIDDDQTWIAIKNARNSTAHEYDEQQALAHYNKVKSYLPHLQALFEKMNTIADDVAEDVSDSAKNPDDDN